MAVPFPPAIAGNDPDAAPFLLGCMAATSANTATTGAPIISHFFCWGVSFFMVSLPVDAVGGGGSDQAERRGPVGAGLAVPAARQGAAGQAGEVLAAHRGGGEVV